MRQSKLTTTYKRRASRSRGKNTFILSDGSTGRSGLDSDIDEIKAIPLPPQRQSTPETDEGSPIRLAPPSVSPKKKSRKVESSDDEKTACEESRQLGSSDEAEFISRPRKRTARKILLDSDEERRRGKRSRLSKGVRPLTPEPDMMEELDEDAIVGSRLRERSKKTRYQKGLEKLQRRKLRNRRRRPSSSNGSEKTNEDSSESADGFSSTSEKSARPFPHARPDHEHGLSEQEEASHESGDDFIEEDDDVVDLPTEFSRNRHRDMAENFKVLCQLLIHVAVKPASDRELHMSQLLEDDYFSTARNDLHRKLSAILTQRITSQIWKKSFLDPLARYPDLELSLLETATPGCHACNSRRLSTLQARLSGSPYKAIGFQPHAHEIDDTEEEEEDEDEDDDTSRPPHGRLFELGRFCAARARSVHNFNHWEYKLFQSLDEGISQAREMQRFDGQPPINWSDGDAVTELLDAQKFIEIELSKLKNMMKRANELSSGYGRGNED